MAQFVKVGSRTEFEDLEAGSSLKPAGTALQSSTSAKTTMRSRIRALIGVARWQKELWRLTMFVKQQLPCRL